MDPRSRPVWADVRWLLILPFAGLLVPAIYARAEPSLYGFPFFYWYQFAWLVATSLLMAFVASRAK